MLDQLNSLPVYAVCGGIVAFVAGVCVVFLVRAYRAGIRLGMDKEVLKRTILGSASFSVLPAVGILLGVIALSGSLGIPWPWLRLSVIGALHYETQVAQAAAEQAGIGGLSASAMTPDAFATIALLMSICIMWGMVLSIFFNRRYTEKLTGGAESGEKKEGGFADLAMSAMFIGLISAYLGSYIGGIVSGNGVLTFTGSPVPLATAAVSGVVMGLVTAVSKKKGLAWLEGFSIALSMLAGMAAACFF